MSLTDAFGPLSTQASSADAIAWVRSSLFARMKGNRYRSPLSIAIMYAAELAAGNVPAKRLRKLEAGRESLEKLGVNDIQRALDVARSAEKAAPDSASREWAARAVAVLSEIGISKLKSSSAVLKKVRVHRAKQAGRWRAFLLLKYNNLTSSVLLYLKNSLYEDIRRLRLVVGLLS